MYSLIVATSLSVTDLMHRPVNTLRDSWRWFGCLKLKCLAVISKFATSLMRWGAFRVYALSVSQSCDDRVSFSSKCLEMFEEHRGRERLNGPAAVMHWTASCMHWQWPSKWTKGWLSNASFVCVFYELVQDSLEHDGSCCSTHLPRCPPMIYLWSGV